MKRKIAVCSVLLFLIIAINSKVNAFTLVIDPGHGCSDPGAQSLNGTYESYYTMKISQYLKEYLSKYDMNVYMTHEGKTMDIIDRALYARSKNADLVVSIHLNALSSGDSGTGAEVWVTRSTVLPKYNKQTTELGNKILTNLNALGIANRGVKICSPRSDSTDVYSDGTRADYYGIICYSMRGCKIDYGVISPAGATPANIAKGEGVPAIIVEHCFCRGSDYQFINSDEKLKKLAEADGKAIVEYYNLQLKSNVPYPDVKRSDWYYNSVEYVHQKGLMNGYTAGTDKGKFGPNDQITRGQIVTILYRREGSPLVSGGWTFKDTGMYDYYNNAIKWAASNGIVTGYTDGENEGKFLPDNPITREELALILKRYAEYKGKDISNTASLNQFKDYLDVSEWAEPGLKWAVAKGIITGDKATNPYSIKPQGNATRAEAATMIMRFCENVK